MRIPAMHPEISMPPRAKRGLAGLLARAAPQMGLALALGGCAVAQAPKGPVLPAEHVVYRCASGRTVEAGFSRDVAVVRYAGVTHTLPLAISASGARFVGDGLVWWTKGSGPGSEGTLYREQPGSSSSTVLESCTWEGVA